MQEVNKSFGGSFNHKFTVDAVFFVIHKALSPILIYVQTEILKSAGKCGVDELNRTNCRVDFCASQDSLHWEL